MKILVQILVLICLALTLSNERLVAEAPASVDVDIPLDSYPTPGVRIGPLTATSKTILMVSIPTVQRVVEAPGDVLDASLKVTLWQPAPAGSILVYRLIHPEAANPVAGTDYDSQPLATFPIEQFKANPPIPKMPGSISLVVPGLGDLVRNGLKDSPQGIPLLFVAAPSGQPNAKYILNGRACLVNITIVSHPKVTLFGPPIRPRDGVFAQSRNGHLYYGDQRLRLWGAVRPQLANTETAARIANMGFNAVRLWGPRNVTYDEKTGEYVPATPGDGSGLDEFDQIFAACKKAGLFIMATGLTNSATHDGVPLSVNADWLKGDGTNWPEWVKAASGPDEWVFNFAAAFDDRAFQTRQKRMKDFLTHVNPYTGKSYAQDEAIAIYELANENAHVKRTLEKGFDKWPPLFVTEIQQRWNKWLTDKYHDDAGLAQAWKKLDPNESLSAGTIKLEPLVTHHAAYSDERASDFVRFLIEIDSDMNKRLEAYARSFAPQGTGVAVVPFSYDTQYQPSTAWLFDNTQNGDTATFGMYFWDQQNPLVKPPGMYVMDSNTVDGKISVIYETMDGRPDPFRSAYPYRVAALASWQDWDVIFFHYWQGFMEKGRVFPDEAYLTGELTYIAPTHYWSSVYYEKDPALLSPMAIAGQMFLSGAITPAAHPVIYTVGGQSLFNMAALSGVGVGRAAFTQGARIRFAPESGTGVTMEGAQQGAFDAPPTGAVAMGDQVLWDWPNGRLIIDTPTAKAYVGIPHGKYRFKDGIVVGGFDGKFVSFGMISADGKPLTGPNATQKIYITAADNAKSTGFHIKLAEGEPGPPGGPVALGKLIDNDGSSPTVVDSVPYQIWFPTDLGGHFTGYDLALRERLEKPVTNGEVQHDGGELYVAVLSIDHAGTKTIDTPQSDAVEASSNVATADSGSSMPAAASVIPGAADVWNPLPGVKWSDGLQDVEAHLRSSGGHLDAATISGDRLHLANTDAVFHSAADADVIFAGGQMTAINVSFTQPPAITAVVDSYDKQFGPATAKKLASSEADVSTAKWIVKKNEVTLTVTLTETQGILGIVYALTP
jgi:hypothetical protein